MQKKGKYFKSTRLLLLSLLLINSIIILLTVRYYRIEKDAFIHQKYDQLRSIADIKINQIVDWRNERYSDAKYLSASPQINQSFRLLLSDTGNINFRNSLYDNLNGMFMNGKYENMIAFDRSGRAFFSLPGRSSDFSSQLPSGYSNSRTVQMGDFYVEDANNTTLKIVIPQVHTTVGDTFLAGWILLKINLTKTFLPLLEEIPIPSKSMQIRLFYKQDNNLLQLIPDGLKQKTIRKFDPSFVDDQFGIGKNGNVVQGKDPDGTSILSVSYPIPESNTFLQVKIDKSEAFEDVKKLGFNLTSLAGLMILAFSSSVSFFWLKQRNEYLIWESEKKLIMERFDMLSKFANDAIIVYTGDLTILQVNDKALELYGYTRDEFLGMSAELLRSPETRSGIPLVLENTIREGGFRFETWHVHKNNSKFPVEVSLRYMELMGAPCFQALVRDITQRKQFEKALIDSEERLRLITNTMPQIAWTARNDGSFEFVNSRFEYLTGLYPLKESATTDFIHPDDRDRVITYWKSAIHDIREHQIRFRIKMKDSTYRWFLCLAIPMCNDSGEVIRWYGSATDIDELENTVAQRTEELSDLYNNAPCGYHSLDTNGRFIKINNTALKWLGYDREEIEGKMSFGDVITEVSRKRFTKNFAQFKKKGFVNNLEYDMVRKDGTILPVLLSATAVRDSNGNIIMTRSTTVDHTARRNHENEILKLNSILQEHSHNLEYANKELEAFTFSVSHDLRAPLRAINGFSQILIDEYSKKLDTEALHMLEKVLNSAIHMRHLIDDLLRLSRAGRQELRYMMIDMQALFNSMLEEVRQQFADRTIKAQVNSMPKAAGDLALLKQVISNLLSNAVKFSSRNSVSEIEAGYIAGDNENVFFVKDNGTGFDMSSASELFGVFRRLSNAEEYEGTGVGLALVKRIIDKHGGKVWAESEPGKGAKFYFSLPVSKIS